MKVAPVPAAFGGHSPPCMADAIQPTVGRAMPDKMTHRETPR